MLIKNKNLLRKKILKKDKKLKKDKNLSLKLIIFITECKIIYSNNWSLN